MEYPYNGILAIKRNKVLIHATTWMNRGNIMLSERRQKQKTRYFMTVKLNIQNNQICIEWVSGSLGRREWGVTV